MKTLLEEAAALTALALFICTVAVWAEILGVML